MLKINEFPPHQDTRPYTMSPPSQAPKFTVYHTFLPPTSVGSLRPSYYDIEPMSRKQCTIHFIMELASCIIGLISGILALASPALSDYLLVWIVITGTAAGIGLINSSYVLCSNKAKAVLEMKYFCMAAITLIISLAAVLVTFMSSMKYAMRNCC